MKILFIVNSRNWDPLGVMQLSSILKQNGHVIDMVGVENDDVYKKVDSFRPDIIGFSAMSSNFSKLLKVNQDLKNNFNFFSIWGGPHPTFFPEIIEEKSIDAIVRGEAEVSIKKVITEMRKGIYEVENLVEDLDSLPLPDRELNDVLSLDPEYSIRGAVFVRGCPYQCTFCFEHLKKEIYKDKGKYIRYKNVTRAIEEIKDIEVKTPQEHRRYIVIRDATFNLNKKWALDFLRMAKKEINTPLNINLRADLVDEEIAQVISDSPVFSVTIGMETGDDYINSVVLKKGQTSKEFIRGTKILRKYKISMFFDTMMALPHETPRLALKTYQLALKCKPKHISIYAFNPYPRLKLTEYAHNKGYLGTSFVNAPGYHFTSTLNFSKKEKLQFDRLHHMASVAYHFRVPSLFVWLFMNLPFDKVYQGLALAYSKSIKKTYLSPKRLSLFSESILLIKFIYWLEICSFRFFKKYLKRFVAPLNDKEDREIGPFIDTDLSQ